MPRVKNCRPLSILRATGDTGDPGEGDTGERAMCMVKSFDPEMGEIGLFCSAESPITSFYGQDQQALSK